MRGDLLECVVRTKLLLADKDPGIPKKVVVVNVVHYISWAKARVDPSRHGKSHGHRGRRSSGSNCTPHLMGSGPGRPVNTHGPFHGPGGAALVEPAPHGPRPGPAHQI